MNTFKRKSLYAALAGVGALGVTGAAQAVNVNPDGLGRADLPVLHDERLGHGWHDRSVQLAVVRGQPDR
jgi:hypothetical protein